MPSISIYNNITLPLSSAGLFRGLSPSCKSEPFKYINRQLLMEVFSVIRSIPAAASTFAAYELTRGWCFLTV